MDIESSLREALSAACEKSGIPTLPANVPLEHTADLENGDYASGIALARAKEVGSVPRALAETIVRELGELDIAHVSVAGPGFINFRLKPTAIARLLGAAHFPSWGKNERSAGKTVMVEYTDPNPFKEFHIGHLMANAIGESFTRLLEAEGARVIRANYQGDVGLHVAKAMFVLLEHAAEDPTASEIGAAYAEGARRYEEVPKAKLDIDALNAEIYDGDDARIRKLYERGRATCLEAFERLYAILGTVFDVYFFESQTAPKGLALVRAHPELFPESQGAVIFPGEAYGLHTRVFINRAGLPTYETKDLGLAQMKAQYAALDRSITVTASEQNDYFAVVKKAIELTLPEWEGKIEHRSHGLMRFAEGKMSSRKGNVVTGESLIEDLTEVAAERARGSRAENPAKLAEQVAVAGVKYQILKQAAGKDIIFDRDRALSLEGDSGPYIQYAHARAAAIQEKAREAGVDATPDEYAEPNEAARLIARFPDVVTRAARNLEPHLIAQYALMLSAAFNSWYAQELILDGTPAAAHKVALAEAVRTTLARSLWLLGIPAPEKM